MSEPKQLLPGHKRVGKRFIPPMKQIPKMMEFSYVDDLLPQLIWLGLINDKVGFIKGARLFEQIALITYDVLAKSAHCNLALLDTFRLLDEGQKAAIVNALEHERVLVKLRICLAPLLILYDNCPINFIGIPEEVVDEQMLIQSMRDCVGNHLDKYKTPGIVLHGSMLLARLVTGTISLPMDIPDFNSVVSAPDSQEAKSAAGFMRANAMAEVAMLKIDRSWSEYFWNRGAELSPCELIAMNNHND